jgi:hypothetical protein
MRIPENLNVKTIPLKTRLAIALTVWWDRDSGVAWYDRGRQLHIGHIVNFVGPGTKASVKH